MAERVFNLPDLGEGLEDAEIVDWKVAEGDAVQLNQPIVEVNTAKAVVEIPSPFAGVVRTLHGAVGDVVEVGHPLITFDVESQPGGEPEAAPPAREAAAPEAPQSKREAVLVGYGVDQDERATTRRPRLRPPGPRRSPATRTAEPAATAAPAAAGGRALASPVVRRLARERGVDLASVAGTGPGGRVTREDVERAGEPAGGPAASAGPEERVAVRGVRRLVAQKMARSWAEIPHVTTFRTVDATHLEALRAELGAEAGTKVTALPIVVRALVEVCRQHPKLNSSWDREAEEIVVKRYYHVGIATDTERGLMVPVVRDADRKGILDLAEEITAVSAAAREGRAAPDALTGSTVTVTNVGSFGSEFGTPIINHPEAAILGIGVIEPRALVVDGHVEARPAVTLSLSFDHRILDGAEAGRAMNDLQALLESPFRLGALPRR